MADLHLTLSQHVMRRLEEATSFKGKLKCKFDPSMPLNMTDLTQPFTTSCETPSELPSLFGLLIVGCCVLGACALGYGCYLAYGWLRVWWTKRKQRLAEEERLGRWVTEQAARNDYCLNVDS